jgi:hypothetical protein
MNSDFRSPLGGYMTDKHNKNYKNKQLEHQKHKERTHDKHAHHATPSHGGTGPQINEAGRVGEHKLASYPGVETHAPNMHGTQGSAAMRDNSGRHNQMNKQYPTRLNSVKGAGNNPVTGKERGRG